MCSDYLYTDYVRLSYCILISFSSHSLILVYLISSHSHRILVSMGETSQPATEQRLGQTVADAVVAVFDNLKLKSGKPTVRSNGTREWTVLAGVVAVVGNDVVPICVATGVKSLPNKYRAYSAGTMVHDLHAEILCLRLFNSYLLQQVKNCDGKIVERIEGGFRLKLGVLLALYVSEPPCGDASMGYIAGDKRRWSGDVSSDTSKVARIGDRDVDVLSDLSKVADGDLESKEGAGDVRELSKKAVLGNLPKLAVDVSKVAPSDAADSTVDLDSKAGAELTAGIAELTAEDAKLTANANLTADALTANTELTANTLPGSNGTYAKRNETTAPKPSAQSLDPIPPVASLVRGRNNYGVRGVVRTKPGRADSEITMSKSCSDKLCLKQMMGITNAFTASFFPEGVFLTYLVLHKSKMHQEDFDRCFHRLLALHPLQLLVYDHDSYRFHKPAEGIDAVPSPLSLLHLVPNMTQVLNNGVKNGAFVKNKRPKPSGESFVCNHQLYLQLKPLLLPQHRSYHEFKLSNGPRQSLKQHAKRLLTGWHDTDIDDFEFI